MSTQTIQQWLKHAQRQLSSLTDAYIEESQILLTEVLQKNHAFLIAHSQDMLEIDTQHQAEQLLQSRLTGKPLAYVLGHTQFYGLPIQVTSDTLIPRNATESLVEYILNHFNKTPISLVDLGTGSGAIACAIAHHRPYWEITATDICPNALSVAKSNAEKLELKQITFLESHWFSKLIDQYFDIIISNPPYIDQTDQDLDDHVRIYEPQNALFSTNNGFSDIEHLLEDAKQHLKPNGVVIIEHGHKQQQNILQLANKLQYTKIQGYTDLSGLDRYIVATL